MDCLAGHLANAELRPEVPDDVDTEGPIAKRLASGRLLRWRNITSTGRFGSKDADCLAELIVTVRAEPSEEALDAISREHGIGGREVGPHFAERHHPAVDPRIQILTGRL